MSPRPPAHVASLVAIALPVVSIRLSLLAPLCPVFGRREVKRKAADEDSAEARPAKKIRTADGVKGKASVPQSHREQHHLKLARRRFDNPGKFELVQESKKVWEKARVKSLKASEREPLIAELVALITGKAHDIIFQHDSARVIQTCIVYGTPAHRATLYNELLPHIVELTKSKYSKFIVAKLLEHGTREQRAQIIAHFVGRVRKLIKHKLSSEVLALAWADYASPKERTQLMQEMYGPEFGIFKVVYTYGAKKLAWRQGSVRGK